MQKKVALALCLTATLGACATPTVVSPTRTTDVALSCPEINAAIEEAERFEQEAREDRGVTVLNVGAAIFFWPALVGTYVNTEEAIEAAESRQDYLRALHDEKNCRS